MQTTLRIQDEIYREAKAQAAREGITLTGFLESALLMKLGHGQRRSDGRPHAFRVFKARKNRRLTDEEIALIAREEQERQDLAKLGLSR